jgi:hypothetical protein
VDITELKVLLALNGRQRIPYAEEEIFSNRSLYSEYLKELCKDFECYNLFVNGTDADLAGLADYYADEIIDGRWLAAEHIIATNGTWAVSYATNIIQGRFPEAESVIADDHTSSYSYAMYVIKARWLEGEAAIARSDVICRWYEDHFKCKIDAKVQ